MGITVLSLFDGISCGMVALERAGIAVITVPLGLVCLFGKKMLIVDNYYFEAKKG